MPELADLVEELEELMDAVEPAVAAAEEAEAAMFPPAAVTASDRTGVYGSPRT